jgi:hypothetical protein
MIRIILLTLIVILNTLSIQAKNTQGQIIYENDTVDVTFIIPVKLITQEIKFEKIQNKIRFYDSNGSRYKLKPNQAKEIRFTYNGKEIRMLSRNKINVDTRFFSGSQNIFLRLIVDGDLKLFKYYDKQRIHDNTIVTPVDVIQKNDEDLKRITNLISNDLGPYISDCPKLIAMIKNKELRITDLVKVVNTYNKECK